MAATPANQDENPFAPGTGHAPEHVVGRKREFALLEGALQGIDRCKIQEDGLLECPSMAPLVLTGPRGVGKTMMLGWMQERAREMGIHVARLAHVKDLLTSGDTLLSLFNEVAGGDEALLQGSRGIFTDAGVDLPKAVRIYRKMLEAKLRQGPVALLMDEAHHYQDEYMEFILRVGEQLIDERHPLVMLVVGTPDLLSYLENIDAGFLERSRVIHINLLATAESKDGIGKPFADQGIEVEPKALEMMWGMTDNYPYFVQLVGEAVWEALPSEGKRRIDVALFDQVQGELSGDLRRFFSLLYDEMSAKSLTSYALQAAAAIIRQQGAAVGVKDIEIVLQQENSDLSAADARSIVERLRWLGFIWRGEEDRLEISIPSFFTYMQAKKQKVAKEMGG